MKTTTEELPVIFRIDKYGKDKQVTAVFPTEPADTAGRYMTCYAHFGQHGSCSYGWYVQKTRPAKPAEYKELLAELRDLYERKHTADDVIIKLKIVHRITQQHRDEYDAELRRPVHA